MSQDHPSASDSAASFSLFDGGPVYRLEERLGLAGAGRQRVGRLVMWIVLIGWFPMLVLAAVQGLAIGPTRLESFLMDFVVNVRFLVTVPVFLLGMGFCGGQLRAVVSQFLDAGLVRGDSRARFDAAVLDAVHLSRSGWTDAALIGLAYLHSGLALGVVLFGLHDPTWRTPMWDGHASISLSGAWYFLVAFPLFSFLAWRWMLRIWIWWRLLRQISKLDLRLTATHRDGVGGVGFLSNSVEAFLPFVFGTTAIAAAIVADFVVYEGDSPLQYQWLVIGFVAVLFIAIAGPTVYFLRPLYKAREEAVFRYGALSSRHIQRVEDIWLVEGGGREVSDASMPDFRSITHVGHSVAAAHAMSIIPLKKDDILMTVIIALLPFIPVFLTQLPVEEILPVLLKVFA